MKENGFNIRSPLSLLTQLLVLSNEFLHYRNSEIGLIRVYDFSLAA